MLPRNFLGDLTTSYGGYLTVEVPGESFAVYIEGNGVGLELPSRKNEVQIIESTGWHFKHKNNEFPRSCFQNLTRPCFMTILQNVTKIGINATNR